MFQFQVLVKEDKKHVWKSVHPTSGQPYEYVTYDEAYRQMEMCYPDGILGETVRVIETGGQPPRNPVNFDPTRIMG